MRSFSDRPPHVPRWHGYGAPDCSARRRGAADEGLPCRVLIPWLASTSWRNWQPLNSYQRSSYQHPARARRTCPEKLDHFGVEDFASCGLGTCPEKLDHLGVEDFASCGLA